MTASKALAGAALAACAGSVCAQSVSPPPNPIVVTATRAPRTADETLASVTVITREEIEVSQARDVAQLLRFQAGIDVARNGGPGQPASIFTRGTDSNHTLVLVDGVRINPGTIGGAPLQFIDPSVVERIEVVRGPRSTLYGSDAIGGVIQIFTRRGAEGTSARAVAGTGTHDTREGGIGAHQRSDDWRFGIDISSSRTDGFPTLTQSAIDRGFRNTSINAYTGIELGQADVEISHWSARGNVEYLRSPTTPLDQDFENAVTAATLKTPLTPNWFSSLRLSRLHDEITQNQSADFVRTERNALDWQNDLTLAGGHFLTVGAFLSDERTASLSFGTRFDVDTDTGAVFIQDQWARGRYRLLGAVRHTDHETFGAQTTGEIAAGFDIDPAVHVYASIGTGFRAPDSTDRFGFGGNPDLDPESSRNVELGARFEVSPTATASLAAFQNDIDDLIIFADPDGFTGPIPRMNQNVQEARIRGLEAGYRLRTRRWTLDASAILQEPENRDTGEQLARRAEQSLTLTALYRLGRYRLGASLLATSERPDSDFSDAVNAGYGIVTLFGQYEPVERLALGARIENLFDKDYEVADGFNTPGRGYLLTLRYRLAPAP